MQYVDQIRSHVLIRGVTALQRCIEYLEMHMHTHTRHGAPYRYVSPRGDLQAHGYSSTVMVNYRFLVHPKASNCI